jgi:hypothetical protein
VTHVRKTNHPRLATAAVPPTAHAAIGQASSFPKMSFSALKTCPQVMSFPEISDKTGSRGHGNYDIKPTLDRTERTRGKCLCTSHPEQASSDVSTGLEIVIATSKPNKTFAPPEREVVMSKNVSLKQNRTPQCNQRTRLFSIRGCKSPSGPLWCGLSAKVSVITQTEVGVLPRHTDSLDPGYL